MDTTFNVRLEMMSTYLAQLRISDQVHISESTGTSIYFVLLDANLTKLFKDVLQFLRIGGWKEIEILEV